MRPITLVYSPTVASANAIALSQTTAGNVAVLLNGATGGVLGGQQKIAITSVAADLSGTTFAIVGKNAGGQVISENLTGPGAGLTVLSTKDYASITSITTSVATAAFTIGVNGLGNSQPIVLEKYPDILQASVAVYNVVGLTYKLQYTYDDVFDPNWPNGAQVWWDHATMTGKNGSFDIQIVAPVMAIRFAVTANGNPQSLTARIVQAGLV